MCISLHRWRSFWRFPIRDAGKHTGAAFLLDHLGLDREELAAFGDGDNDAELLAFAGIGIAVENASPEVQGRRGLYHPVQ